VVFRKSRPVDYSRNVGDPGNVGDFRNGGR
jgi:hypothetical protein